MKVQPSTRNKMKKYHDQRIEKKEFVVDELALLFNFTLFLYLGKLKSKWTWPFLIMKEFPHGVFDLEKKECIKITFNGKRINIYIGACGECSQSG